MTERQLRVSEADFMLCLQVLRADSLESVLVAVVEHQFAKTGSVKDTAKRLGIAPATVRSRLGVHHGKKNI